MATHGTLTVFNASTGTWTSYVDQLNYYFVANDIKDDKKQVAILLSACGQSTFATIRSLVDEDTLKGIKFADLIKVLTAHYDPAPSSIVQRYKFYNRVRAEGETVANYIASLRAIAKYCDYGDTLNMMLRDRLVCGINHQGIQRRLLAEKSLPFDKALEIALAVETAEKDMKQIQKPPTNGNILYHSQHKGHQPPRKDIQPRGLRHPPKTCHRCLGEHASQTCPFKQAECHKCKKVGHIAKACKTRIRQEKPDKQTKATHYVDDMQDTTEPVDNSYDLFTLSSRGQEPILVSVTLNQTPVQMELDTGASLSLLNKPTFDVITSNTHTTLKATDVHLKTYTGETVEVLGAAELAVTYGEQTKQLVVHVVAGNGPNLMGRDWLYSLKVSIGEIHKVQVPNGLPELLEKHKQVFSDGLGTFKGGKVTLQIEAQCKPKFFKARTLPFSLKEKVENELERLEGLGIITPVAYSNWAAPIVPVVKRDGSIRLCGDYRITVNQAAKVDTYPLPKVEDLFAAMSGGKFFTKLDMSQAYLQLQLDDKSKELVTINTHKGLFQYNRLPFGVASAPAVFQRCMEGLFQGCEGVSIYLDDLLVTGSNIENHMQNLDKVLSILSTNGLRLNKSKCAFLLPKVEYLGHVIDEQGLHPTKEKVKAIQEAPRPHNVAELRSFLGIINYYGKFLPNLSTRLAPLYQLLKRGVKWQWNKQQEKAYEAAKDALQDDTLLVHYDSTRQLVVACDASQYGLGAVLSHIMDNGEERPVAYASRTLTAAEKNYSQLEKEALGVVFAVKKFHTYLFGRHFIIESDHRPLSYLFNSSKAISPTASSRITRWTLTLSAYTFTIRYKPGRNLGNADALSRLPQTQATGSDCQPAELLHLLQHLSSTTINAASIRRWTDTHPTLSKIRQFILQGWPTTQLDEEFQPYCKRKSELSVLDGCILWGARVIVPPQGRKLVLEELHDTHLGASKMKSLARAYIWWPKMDTEIEHLAKSCSSCQETNSSPAKAPLHPWEWPALPWSRLHLDFAGPYLGHMFLVLVDAHSKWLDVQLMHSITSENTISKLKEIFSIHGLPQKIVTDNGSSFTSSTFKGFMERNGIKHICSAPYHPSTNGLAERAVQTFKRSLAQIEGTSIKEKLNKFLFKYRITPHTVTGVAPAELLMGRRLRSRLDLLKPDLSKTVQGKQFQQKLSHDNEKAFRKLMEGDLVYVKDFSSAKPKWISGTIHESTGPVSYSVILSDGNIIRRHVDHIKARYQAESNVTDGTEFDLAFQPSSEPLQEPMNTEQSSSSDHPPTSDDTSETTVTPSLRPSRIRRPPTRFDDFIATEVASGLDEEEM